MRSVVEQRLARDLLLVEIGAVGRAVVDCVPGAGAALEVGVAARHRIALEHDVVVGTATNAKWAAIEDEALSEQAGLGGVDHHQAVVARPLIRGRSLHDLGHSRFFVVFAHETRPLAQSFSLIGKLSGEHRHRRPSSSLSCFFGLHDGSYRN